MKIRIFISKCETPTKNTIITTTLIRIIRILPPIIIMTNNGNDNASDHNSLGRPPNHSNTRITTRAPCILIKPACRWSGNNNNNTSSVKLSRWA